MALVRDKGAGDTFGFEQLIELLDAVKFESRTQQAFDKAQNRIGLVFVAMARKKITVDKVYAPNSPATIALKRSSLPLVETGDLVGSITYDVKDPFRVLLGINSVRLSGGRFLYEVLHNGATIRRGNSVWVIPPRPFLSAVWEDPDFIKTVTKFYLEALVQSLLPKGV